MLSSAIVESTVARAWRPAHALELENYMSEQDKSLRLKWLTSREQRAGDAKCRECNKRPEITMVRDGVAKAYFCATHARQVAEREGLTFPQDSREG
jgi:hypothetical protein